MDAEAAIPIRPGSFLISTSTGAVAVDGWICDCIGLGLEAPGVWRLTHLPTGLGVTNVGGQAAAWRAARDLAPLMRAPATWQTPPADSYPEAKAYVQRLRRQNAGAQQL